MLDRERADFFRVLDALRAQLSDKCVAVHLPIGSEHELTGIVDLLHMQAYLDPGGQRESGPTDIPAEMQAQVEEYREKLLDSVVETDEVLMERYLEGQELSTEEVAKALKDAVTRGDVFPVACGVASKNLGTTAVLDLLVEGVPSPAKKGAPIAVEGGGTAAFVFKTIADPFAGRINVFRVLNGTLKGDSTIVNARSHAKERLGQLMQVQGKDHTQVTEFGEGDIGAVAKLEGDADRRRADGCGASGRAAGDRLPRARDELRREPEGQRRRGKDGGRRYDGSARRIRRFRCVATRRPASSC